MDKALPVPDKFGTSHTLQTTPKTAVNGIFSFFINKSKKISPEFYICSIV